MKLNETQREIIKIIADIWIKHPELRFTQLLFNLNINQFTDADDFNFIDNHHFSDLKTLEIIKKSNFYSMTYKDYC